MMKTADAEAVLRVIGNLEREDIGAACDANEGQTRSLVIKICREHPIAVSTTFSLSDDVFPWDRRRLRLLADVGSW